MRRTFALAAMLAIASYALPARADEEVRQPASPPAPERALDDRGDRRWTLSAGTGAGSIFEFADATVGGIGAGLVGYQTTQSGRFQVNARVDRELGPRVRAGIAYTHLRWTRGYFTSAGASVEEIDSAVHVLVGDLTLRWVRTRRLELYSGAGAGVATLGQRRSATAERERQSGYAFQLRLVGLSVGSERVRIFGELGLGFEGLLIGGVAVRL